MFSLSAAERRALMTTAREVLAHGGSESERRRAFPEFLASHPKLFGIICSGRCELAYLENMLKRMEDVEAGGITVEEASKETAGELNRTYIEQVIPKPTAAQAATVDGPTVEVVEKHRAEHPASSKKGTKRGHDVII